MLLITEKILVANTISLKCGSCCSHVQCFLVLESEMNFDNGCHLS